jgi:hypothetical protein
MLIQRCSFQVGLWGNFFFLLAKENEKSEIPKCGLFLLSNKVKN